MRLYGRSVPAYKGRRNLFDLSYNKVFDFDIGQAIPFLFDEVLPGDIWKCSNECVVKFPILNAPVFQRFRVKKRYFFVTNRVACLAFNNHATFQGTFCPWSLNGATLDYSETPWEHFITGGKTGQDSMTERYSVSPSHFGQFELMDYLGVPDLSSLDTTEIGLLKINVFKAFCVYNAIYNAFFRNENFQAEREPGNYSIFDVNWAKDRYTSALAEQQRGVQPSITPSVAFGDIDIVAKSLKDSKFDFSPFYFNAFTGAEYGVPNRILHAGVGMDLVAPNKGFIGFIRRLFGKSNVVQAMTSMSYSDSLSSPGLSHFVGGFGSKEGVGTRWFNMDEGDDWQTYYLKGQFSNDDPLFNVADLRLMFQTQKFLEMNERAGYRYVEQLQARFGVRPQDSRLDRPLYLGGDTQDVVVTQVNATSSGDGLATFKGQGVSASSSKPVVLRAKEHGWIVGIMYVVPDAVYGQRIDPQFFAKGQLDYYTPEFAHLSEQPVYTKEIYPKEVLDDGATGDEIFGFQGIYDEYRSKQSMVCGNFRAGGNLSDWTAARSFSFTPTLSSTFLQVPKFRNLFVSDSDPSLYCLIANRLKVYRRIPKYATPGLIDHA